MKKHIVVNRRFIFCITLLLFFFISSLFMLLNKDMAGIFCFVFALCIGALFLIAMPIYATCNSTSIYLWYAFGRYETARWDNIREIVVEFDGSRFSQHMYYFSDLEEHGWFPKGNLLRRSRFPKNRRTDHLILQYWKTP